MSIGKTLDYRLRWLDFDRYGHIQPTAVLDLLQDVATIQAEEMGIGRDAMLAREAFWAVVRLKYEVVREPEHFQIVHVKTWPHTLTSFSFLRDFSISDKTDNLLIKATSEWVLMNVKTRKFAKVKNYYDGPHDFDEMRTFDSKPRKIPDFDEKGCPAYTVVPSFCDIDVNGHVNNARYPGFVMNALAPGSECAIRALQIDYRYEALPGAPLSIYTHAEDGRLRAKGMREDGVCAFACAIDLRK